MIRPTIRRAVRILVASEFSRREVAEMFGISERSVKTIVREAVQTATELLAAHRNLRVALDAEVA